MRRSSIEFSKVELIEKIKEITESGWVHTNRTKNDGAVGNTLEDLLGIPENNLAIANTVDWEIKAQRTNTNSLVTLFHIDPNPRKPTVVSKYLLPTFGWQHPKAGIKYPRTERSFRATLTGDRYTDRGLKINVNSVMRRVELVFDHSMIDLSTHKDWYAEVLRKNGTNELKFVPYWTFDELNEKCVGKIRNTIFVLADSRINNGQEEFYYKKILLLEDFAFNNLLRGIINGKIFIDFDARTGHNHGTKFRLKSQDWLSLFSKVTEL